MSGPRTPPAKGDPPVYGLRLPRRRRGGSRELAHAAIWLLGVAGFLGPMILARHSPHADLLRAGALAWFIVFGLINGLFVFRALPRRRSGRGRRLDR